MTENVKPKAKKYNKPYAKTAGKKPFKKVENAPKVAPELEAIVKIVKYNANIKRHTSLNILNRFVEDGFIDEAKGAFVDFMWDKYTVKCKGITKEYTYDQTFVEALVKAHEDMAKDNTRVIGNFVKFAGIE